MVFIRVLTLCWDRSSYMKTGDVEFDVRDAAN